MTMKDLQRDKPGLARAGVIRLGYKVKRCQNKTCKTLNLAEATRCQKCNGQQFGKEYPTPADHFVLRDAPGVAEALGTSEPRELRVWLPFNEIENVFPAYHQYWVASALVCRGDGEIITYAINPQMGRVIIRDGRVVEAFESKGLDGQQVHYDLNQLMPCPGVKHDLYPKCANCKPNAMLLVMLRDVPRMAYYQIATTSIWNIVNLTSELVFIQEKTGGRLSGVPFVLKLEEREISVPAEAQADGNGKRTVTGRQRVKKWLLSLEVDEDWYRQLLAVERQLAAPDRLLALPEFGGETQNLASRPAPDVVYAQPPPQPSRPFVVEPPVWLPPNGGDDSGGDEEDDDWPRFAADVIDAVPFYADADAVAQAMADLGLEYDPENEQHIFDTLADYAGRQADRAAGEQPELPLS